MCSRLPYEISIGSLKKLEDVYVENLPKHIVTHSTIRLFIKRFGEFPQLRERFRLLALSDDWESDGAFFATVGD